MENPENFTLQKDGYQFLFPAAYQIEILKIFTPKVYTLKLFNKHFLLLKFPPLPIPVEKKHY